MKHVTPAKGPLLLVAALLGTLALAAGPPRGARPVAAPAPSASDPTEAVRQLLEGIQRFGKAEARESAAATVRPLLDVEGLARFVLGAEWSRRSAAEQSAFVALLAELLQRRAFPKAATFFEDVTIRFGETRPASEEGAEVETEVTSLEEGTVVVAYRLTRSGSAWRVADVVLDGVSLRVNLRATSQKLLREKGYAGLVENMRTKLTEKD
jgi:phospholipid transport system substrate-binding protein